MCVLTCDLFSCLSKLFPDYKYSESGIYFCPESVDCTTIDDYQKFIDKLPIVEEPEIFGMHENANIAYQVRHRPFSLCPRPPLPPINTHL